MLVTLKGKQNYFLTDEEGLRVAENLEKKKMTFITRLGGLMISEFQIDYFGPINQEFVGKEIYADANGIFYYNDGKDWHFWHLLPTPEEYRSSMDKYKEAMDYIMRQDYLKLKFSNNPVLAKLSDVKLIANNKANLPSVISSEIRLIGTDRRLAREENFRLRHKHKIEEFKTMTVEEKIKTYDGLGWTWEGIKEFAEEFEDIFFQIHGKTIEEYKKDSLFYNL
jgi:hypothetical protein